MCAPNDPDKQSNIIEINSSKKKCPIEQQTQIENIKRKQRPDAISQTTSSRGKQNVLDDNHEKKAF